MPTFDKASCFSGEYQQKASSALCLYQFRLGIQGKNRWSGWRLSGLPRNNTTHLPPTRNTSRVITFVLFQPALRGIFPSVQPNSWAFAVASVTSFSKFSAFSALLCAICISSSLSNTSVSSLCPTRQYVLRFLSSVLYIFQQFFRRLCFFSNLPKMFESTRY